MSCNNLYGQLIEVRFVFMHIDGETGKHHSLRNIIRKDICSAARGHNGLVYPENQLSQGKDCQHKIKQHADPIV
jgi:hypothetical protein